MIDEQECLELLSATNPLPRRVVENLYRSAPDLLRRESLESMIHSNFADPRVGGPLVVPGAHFVLDLTGYVPD